ncbi:uncharacterized protein PV07_01390 [Cladophialophora immunda]|uniref:Uncharacterized protein n=1 Tax=Cladophialophora immunda TaxID=569365 RepID=A0A0D2CXL5_9EURO|nr:uncharacterized protein PV07_01390 [Cladophialophora immunda]KIW34620.1 hypothetical protein PV07_01390 [Cladophialophora immunda]
MCGSGCGLLYEPDVPLEDITCPCGKGYWNVFEERFVDGDQVRRGAAARRQYEARVRETLSAEEYTAKIRHQWIVHFLDCEIKRSMDDEAREKGVYSDATMRRALAELYEMSQGDYTSRGTSQTLGSPSALQALRPQGGDPRLSLMPPGDNDDQADTLETPVTTARAVRTDHITRQSRFPPGEGKNAGGELSYVPGGSRSGARADSTQARPPEFFLPSEGISLEVLKLYHERGVFGRQTSVESHSRDGKEGYLIEGQDLRYPTPTDIAKLKQDSRRFEAETITRLHTDRRPSTERREAYHKPDDRSLGHRRSSQAGEDSAGEIARGLTDLDVDSNAAREYHGGGSTVRRGSSSGISRRRKPPRRESLEPDDN